MKARLRAQLGADEGDRWYAIYESTRGKLVQAIYGEIKGIEPNLSDHSERHIDNVLDNVFFLLGDDYKIHGLSGVDLYCLGMIVLFHDVGNLFGREEHHKKISEVFDWARGTDATVRREKTLVLSGARAHTGIASDGSRDTLKELTETDHLAGFPVRLRDLAAVLRLADELAEGPQRTSDFMCNHHKFSQGSQVFHEYAGVTHIFIDRANGRICVTYEIDIKLQKQEQEDQRDRRLMELLRFVYKRLTKMNQERQYARFYSEILAPFKATSVEMNFCCEGKQLPISLPPIHLEDKVVPGDPARTIDEINSCFEANALISELKALAAKVETQ